MITLRQSAGGEADNEADRELFPERGPVQNGEFTVMGSAVWVRFSRGLSIAGIPVIFLMFFAMQLAAQDAGSLRVLSWNIHHGEGVDGKLDLERIAAVIRGVNPDIVALQEVEVGSSRTNRVDQPAELARMTGLTSVFQQNIEFRGGGYGNAILSRLPVLSTKRLSLPNYDNGEQRGALSVQLRLPDRADPLTFICTHLDHRPDDRERRDSAEAIEQHISGLPEGLMILAGDLNAVPQSPVLDIFRRQWTIAGSQPLLTIPVDRPSQQIDFVLIRPEQRWSVTATRVLEEPVASDHRPIFAELHLR